MHKLESFALSSNAKIEKPSIEECFFPILEDNFICIGTASNEDAKTYDYFDDVVFHIRPFLEEKGISIVQIGNSSDRPLFYCKPYLNTNRLHNSYIIGKSLLYLGNFNLYTNIASLKNKNIVCPVNIEYTKSIFPYWSNEDNCKLIQHNPNNLKPSGVPQEPNKTINDVPPEVLASEVLNFLGIKHNLDKIETIHIGNKYTQQVTEVVPFAGFDPNTQIGESIIVRLDKSPSFEALPAMAHNRKLKMVIDKLPDLNILKNIINSIENITYLIDAKTPKEEIEAISALGKPVNLYSRDKKNIGKIRLNFIDYDINLLEKPRKSHAGIKKVSEDMKFLSRKNIVSNGQIFNSYLSEEDQKNTSSVKDSDLLWEDVDYIRIFKDKS